MQTAQNLFSFSTLNFPADNFDQENTFTFQYNGRKGPVTCKGYLLKEEDGEIIIMKESDCLKSHYSKEDIKEQSRLACFNPLKTGDFVQVDGMKYQVKILGNYSDAGRLILV